MTSVYGVTFIGARQQIASQLKELPKLKDLTHSEECSLSVYLAKKTISSLGVMFNGARQIQHWLEACAQLISRCVPSDFRFGDDSPQIPSESTEPMHGVAWTTPLGLPIVQPYREFGVTKVR
jgi:DNA-directed RNA polymerase, mitochondrial